MSFKITNENTNKQGFSSSFLVFKGISKKFGPSESQKILLCYKQIFKNELQYPFEYSTSFVTHTMNILDYLRNSLEPLLIIKFFLGQKVFFFFFFEWRQKVSLFIEKKNVSSLKHHPKIWVLIFWYSSFEIPWTNAKLMESYITRNWLNSHPKSTFPPILWKIHQQRRIETFHIVFS